MSDDDVNEVKFTVTTTVYCDATDRDGNKKPHFKQEVTQKTFTLIFPKSMMPSGLCVVNSIVVEEINYILPPVPVPSKAALENPSFTAEEYAKK